MWLGVFPIGNETSERELAAAEAFHHVLHAAGAAHLLHHRAHLGGGLRHLAYLAELFDELIHFHDRSAGTGGDALAAGAFDDLRGNEVSMQKLTDFR